MPTQQHIYACAIFQITIKRCRMYYYLEVMKYAMKETPDEEPDQVLIDSVNIEAKKFRLRTQPFISQEMDGCIQKELNDNKFEFMKHARKKGYKG